MVVMPDPACAGRSSSGGIVPSARACIGNVHFIQVPVSRIEPPPCLAHEGKLHPSVFALGTRIVPIYLSSLPDSLSSCVQPQGIATGSLTIKSCFPFRSALCCLHG